MGMLVYLILSHRPRKLFSLFKILFFFFLLFLGEFHYLILPITDSFFASYSLLLNPYSVIFGAVTLCCGGAIQLVCRSFSEVTDPYVAVDSLPQREGVSSGSSYSAILNCLQDLTFRKVSQLAKLWMKCLIFLLGN